MRLAFLALSCAALCFVDLSQSHAAVVVAGLRGDYQTGSTVGESAVFTNGWSYLWNAPVGWSAGGSSGDATTGELSDGNYTPLVWGPVPDLDPDDGEPPGDGWAPDRDGIGGTNQPAGFLQLTQDVLPSQPPLLGHPGLGSRQLGGLATLLTDTSSSPTRFKRATAVGTMR